MESAWKERDVWEVESGRREWWEVHGDLKEREG